MLTRHTRLNFHAPSAASRFAMLCAPVNALALLIAANATPVVIAKLTARWPAAPLDMGCVLRDAERLLGPHKTWRGLASGVLAGAAVAAVLSIPLWIGAGFAAVSLAADALSSFVKRRMRVRPGAEIIGLDQLAETLAPLVVFAWPLGLGVRELLAVAVIFGALDVFTAPLRSRRWF